MRSESAFHDAAWTASVSVLHVFAPLLREEEQRTAFEEIYGRLKEAFRRYEEKADRIVRRVKPSKN